MLYTIHSRCFSIIFLQYIVLFYLLTLLLLTLMYQVEKDLESAVELPLPPPPPS